MLIWFSIGIVFVLIELIGFGLVSIWFALGAFITMFFEYLPINQQFYIFVTVSVLSLIMIRKIAVKKFKNKYIETNRILNKKIVIKEKKENGSYTVYIDGKYWTAICDENLNIGDVAVVEKIEGNKLILNIKNRR